MAFSIETEWTSAAGAPDLMRETAAELTIKVEEKSLTRNFDYWSKTVSERARVSAYPLAAWLAQSWWRLSYEPAPEATREPSPDWCLAHDLPAAGGGYVWPRIRIATDGEVIVVSARMSPPVRWEPGQYLANLPPTRIPRAIFEREVDSFLDLVLERLRSMEADLSSLASLWGNVIEERADPEVRDWRKLEARLGYFADEAPETLINEFASLIKRMGEAAASEIAPVVGADDSLQRLRGVRALSEASGIQGNLAWPDMAPVSIKRNGSVPWERGRLLAIAFRGAMNIQNGPVSDGTICELLGVSHNSFSNLSNANSLLGLGVRGESSGQARLHFHRRNMRGRRFEAVRFIADALVAPAADRWLPQTDAATARQQTQRAFAAEFLMPIDDVRNFLGQRLTDDAIEDAADAFNVSDWAIRHHLVNHGLLPTETIWTGHT